MGVLHVRYDYESLRRLQKSPRALYGMLESDRFSALLPVSASNWPKLRIGQTPLYQLEAIDGQTLPFKLMLKDDSQNPSYSLKDRASGLVAAYAAERDYPVIVAASTGNAGSSLAAICASSARKAVILLPEAAPVAKRLQAFLYGARVIPVMGNYDDAFDLSVAATEAFGWYNRNTGYNPLTIEGKKIVAFEMAAQLGFKVPDRVFVPTGDGVILSGVYKGFEDLMMTGITDRMPEVVAVQADGSNNLVANLKRESFVAGRSKTIADSISVDVPRNFYMARKYLNAYNGKGITVSDHDILDAMAVLARNTGLFAEPASAAAFAGLVKYKNESDIAPGSVNMVLLTGSGLKDTEAVRPVLSHIRPIEPDPEALIKYLEHDPV